MTEKKVTKVTKVTPNKSKKSTAQKRVILENIKKGHTFTDACKFAGISRKQAYQWRNKNKEFEDDYQAARQVRLDKLTAKIERAKDWRATAWIAERCHAEKFGRKTSAILDEEYIAQLQKAHTPAERLLIYENALNKGDLSLDGFNSHVNALRVDNELLTATLQERIEQLLNQKETAVKPYARTSKSKP